MKKTVILGILGIAVTAVSSYGQGIVFGNYTSSGLIGAPVSSTATPPTGMAPNTPVGSQFSMQLLYFNGTSFVSLGSPVAFLDGAYAGYTSAAPSLLIPGWTSGPVTFEYTAFNNVVIAGHALGTYIAWTAPFTMTPVNQAWPNYPDLSTAIGYSPIFFNQLPEPSTLTFGSLGLAALVAYRRKQK